MRFLLINDEQVSVSEVELIVYAVELTLPIIVKCQVVRSQLTHFDPHGRTLLLNLLKPRH